MHFRLLDKIYFLYLFSRKFYLRSLVPISSLRDVITSLLAGELRPSREKQHFEVIFLSPAFACSRTTFDRGRRSAWFGPTLLINKNLPKRTGFYLSGSEGRIISLRFIHCAHRFQRPRYFRLAFACSRTTFSLVRPDLT